MKKKIVFVGLVAAMVLSLVLPAGAQQDKKELSRAENLKRAQEIFKRNQTLFKNREMLERYQRIAQSLKKKN